MRIKKYIVNTMPEAMNLIRQDLGKNAVILNSKQIKTGGFFGFFTKRQIEVVAAVDQAEVAPSNPTFTTSPQIQQDIQHEKAQLDMASLQRASNPAAVSQELVKEIKDMRELMTSLINKKGQLDTPEEVSELQHYLLDIGINANLTGMVIHRVMQRMQDSHRQYDAEVAGAGEAGEAITFKLAEQEIKDLLNENPTVTLQELSKSRYISFLGPTGVGKTTTIAKLAAYFILTEKKKLAFVTSDTYRIAAVEQLKTYASILNVPVKVIYSETELRQALDELSDYDIVLMDTAGRNYMQQQYVNEIKALVSSEEQMRKCLVLSLTTGYADNQQIIESFSNLGIDGLILTKQDETKQIGQIANLVYEHKLPIYLVTNGQNVPDDLLLFQPELLTKLMMGEDEHERSS